VGPNCKVQTLGLFGSAPTPLKTAPALAPLVERLFFDGAEAVLKNVWQNGFT
jgi:hypothetical protein